MLTGVDIPSSWFKIRQSEPFRRRWIIKGKEESRGLGEASSEKGALSSGQLRPTESSPPLLDLSNVNTRTPSHSQTSSSYFHFFVCSEQVQRLNQLFFS